MLGSYAMNRVAANAHLSAPWLFEPAKRPEPTTAWTAISFASASTTYSFLHLSGMGRARWAISNENSA